MKNKKIVTYKEGLKIVESIQKKLETIQKNKSAASMNDYTLQSR